MSVAGATSLVVVMIALAAVPSASVALVVARSASHGFGNGLFASLGIVCGDLIFIMLAVLGMTYLAETMGAFFSVLKFVGGGYLMWLGICLVRSKGEVRVGEPARSKKSFAASFLAGFFLTLGDVKAIIFYASLLPMFLDLQALSLGDVGLVALVTVITVGGVKLVYAAAARKIVARLEGRMANRAVTMTAGGLMIGAGGYVISKA